MAPLLFGVVPSYGLLLLVAFFVGSEAAARAGATLDVPRARILAAATLVQIAAIFGARLLFLVEERPTTWQTLWQGGLTFAGSIPAALITVALLARRWRMRLSDLVDPLCHAAAIGQAIGRIGCFLAGCCYGVPGERFAVHFAPDSVAGPEPARLPTQLVESLLAFGLFFLLRRNKKWLLMPYRTLAVYLIGLGAIRLLVEPWRGDQLPLAVFGSVATATSAVIVGVGLALFALSRRAPERTPPL